MNIKLEARKLYIVSAPPGVGKSTLLETLGRSRSDMIVSSDALREQLLGTWTDVNNKVHRYSNRDKEVFEIMQVTVEARAKERLTTFVDATNTTDKDRKQWANLAHKHGQQVEVLILTLPEDVARQRNLDRSTSLPESALTHFYAKFQQTSELPFKVIDMTERHTLELVPLTIPEDSIDVVGDVHGLYADLVELLQELGYVLEPGMAPVHPDGRKLLFLGDMVDRGPDSLKVVDLVMAAVNNGHYAIKGNHETKLVRFWQAFQANQATGLSVSAAETAMAFAKLSEKDRDRVGTFLQNLPVTYVWGNAVGFVHADLNHYDPITTPGSCMLFGSDKSDSPLDVDAQYSEMARFGVNKFLLIRGHITPTGVSGNTGKVVSLEDNQAFGGNLVALPLDKYWAALQQGTEPIDAFEQCAVKHKCEFDFALKNKDKIARLQALTKLKTSRLAYGNSDASGLLTIWKYSHTVFWDKLWGSDAMFLKARGLVLDQAGDVVVHPFDKVFNMGEEGAGNYLVDTDDVVAVTKLNGFMGAISPHPFKHELLVTTTGSFESDFVGYIKDHISSENKGKMLHYYHSTRKLTLLFEVIHEKDPHIIEYPPEMQGLFLIGARELEWDAKPLPEEELDILAQKLGFRRPSWQVMKFGQLREKMLTERGEGYMLRTVPNQDYIAKWKSAYYLTTKFFGRLSDKNIRKMFKNPREFKKDQDEEFYFLVDWIVQTFTEASYMALPEEQRLTQVRGFIQRTITTQ